MIPASRKTSPTTYDDLSVLPAMAPEAKPFDQQRLRVIFVVRFCYAGAARLARPPNEPPGPHGASD